jgi:hypothetical protein
MQIFLKQIKNKRKTVEVASINPLRKDEWILIKATITKIWVDNIYYLAYPLLITDRQCIKKFIQKNNNS